MRRFVTGVVLGLVFGLAIAAVAQNFTTGQNYLSWGDFARAAYGWGSSQGVSQASVYPSTAQKIGYCIANWTQGQMSSAIEGYVYNREDMRSLWIGDLAWNALLHSCNLE